MQMSHSTKTIGLTMTILATVMCCCHVRTSTSPEACGPSLTREQVLRAADRYLSRYSARTAAELNPTIHEIGCNYAVVFSNGTEEAREDLILIVDRQGRI
jgi:hypothetical protein